MTAPPIIWKCYDGSAGDPYRYRCSTFAPLDKLRTNVMAQFCEDAFGPGTSIGVPDTNARWQIATSNILETVQFGFRDETDRMMFICRF